MPSSLLYSIQQAQDPLPEDGMHPEIHDGIANSVVRVMVPVVSEGEANQKSNRTTSCHVFLRRKCHAKQVYQIVSRNVFAPIELSHGGPLWGHVFLGYILPLVAFKESRNGSTDTKKKERLYRQPVEENECQKVAIKRLDLRIVSSALREGCREDPYREIFRLQTMGDNYHVLPLLEALRDKQYLYIITPWCDGGSLLDRIPLQASIQSLCGGKSTEDQARKYFRQMMEDLEYIHEQHGVGHRDIKPGNFLLNDKGRLLLSDFAMSYKIPPSGIVKHMGRFGTPQYLVPEVYNQRPFDARQCDLWACVVSLFNMMTGLHLYSVPSPRDTMFRYNIIARGVSGDFQNERVQEMMFLAIDRGDTRSQARFTRISEHVLTMSVELLQLFEKALTYNASHRWTRKGVMQCRWMQKGK
jgi:serine/threonine protein kinase